MIPRNVEDEIVALATLGEVLLGVINDAVGAERSDHIQFLRVVDAGHIRSVRFGKLYGESTHTTTSTIDQDLLSWRYPSLILKVLQGDESGGGYGRGLIERDVVGLQGQGVFRNRHILGEGAAVVPLIASDALAEYLIARTEPRHVLADRLNVPCHVRSRNAVLWLEQPRPHQTNGIRAATHDVPDIWMDGSRVNPYQDLVILDDWLVDFSELEDIR